MDSETEMTKILAKIMQSSYKKKEISDTVDRILTKMEAKVFKQYDDSTIRSLRLEFEEIRKDLYGI